MGVIEFGPAIPFALGVDDELLGAVYAALKEGLAKGLFVSVCAADGDSGGYLEIDVALFVPGVVDNEGNEINKDSHIMFARPRFFGAEVPADNELLDQILEVMEETDGCVVLDAQDKPVLSVEHAQHVRRIARRINPYEGIVFPDPSHD